MLQTRKPTGEALAQIRAELRLDQPLPQQFLTFLKNIVHGINHRTITDSDRIVSAASCTTNAITPVLVSLCAHA